ncbi:MAG: rhomboid family intramembrane serine protease [Cytophagaceae bacterium]|nr:rhomboid family intramembrane serine protease [Cytophagaceae bacterium]
MGGIFDDLKNAFRKQNNQVVQMILIFSIVFVLHWLLTFSFKFLPDHKIYSDFLNKNFFLSTSIVDFLRHPWTILIFPFTNSNIIELIFNSLALFWFGHILTDFLGGRKVLLVFVSGAIAGAVLYTISAYGLQIIRPFKPAPYLFGASAGIYAVLFAAVGLLPLYEMMFFRFFIKLKHIAIAFLIISLLVDYRTGILHLGAASFGYFYVKFLRTGLNFTQPLESLILKMEGMGKQKPDKKISRTYSKSPVGEYQRSQIYDDQNYYPDQEEIDYLLDKINKSGGYESLTKTEKDRLFRASQKKD